MKKKETWPSQHKFWNKLEKLLTQRGWKRKGLLWYKGFGIYDALKQEGVRFHW